MSFLMNFKQYLLFIGNNGQVRIQFHDNEVICEHSFRLEII